MCLDAFPYAGNASPGDLVSFPYAAEERVLRICSRASQVFPGG